MDTYATGTIRRAAVSAAWWALLLGGCTGEDTVELPDACDLATAAELTTMTGIEFGAAEPDTESSTEHDSVCYWQPIDDIHPVVMVAVSDDPEAGARFRVEVQELVEDSVVIDGAGQVWMDLSATSTSRLPTPGPAPIPPRSPRPSQRWSPRAS